MRDTPKGDGSVLEKDRKEEKLKSEDSTRNNLEKGRDSEMNLRSTRKEPVEATESVSSLINEVKELNITGEELEADTLAKSLDKLNIKGQEDEMQKRGPHGGKPVEFRSRMDNKHIPVGPPLLPQYRNPQIYQPPPDYAAQHGRRMLEEADEPPRQFRRPAPNFVPPPMQHFDVNNFNQAHMPNMFNPNMMYQPGPMMFGGQYPAPQAAEFKLTAKNNLSGGTVTVNSPEMALQDPFEGNQNIDVDEFLETISVSAPTQLVMPGMPSSMNNISQSGMPSSMNNISQPGMPSSMNNISQPGMPLEYCAAPTHMTAPPQMMHGTTQVPINPNMSPGYNYKSDFSGPNFKDPQTRRRSDPNDSGVESAGEASPYPESTPSPNGSTYTSPPSVDSGCSPSPKYDPFSPGSQYSTNGSPPKYTGMVTSPFSEAGSETSGYGSPDTPYNVQTPAPTMTPPAPDMLPANVILGDGSKYIDEHLDGLHDALNVIADDIKHDAQRKATRKQPESQTTNLANRPGMGSNTFQPPPSVLNTGAQQPAHAPAPAPGTIPPPVPTTTSGVTTIILPPAQPQQSANNNPVFLVPIQPGSAPPPIMIVTNANQKAQPQRTKPRKILPKLAPTGTNPDSAVVPTPAQIAAKNVKMPSPPNSQVVKQQQKNLNMARRNVAAVQRDNLIQVDEEGDTYLHIAVVRTDRFMIQALLERLHREHLMPLVDQENSQRQTPLFLAVTINEPVKVHLLVKAGANPNTLAQNLSSDGQTLEVKAAIHKAAVGGAEFLKSLEELLKAADISINIVNNYGQTALHCAILAHGKPKKNGEGSIDSIPIIQALIKKGADPSAQDKKSGKTPLMYAIEHRNLALVETILSTVEPSKVRSVVKRQAFDGSSCMKIAEGIKRDFNDFEWNRLWDSLQRAVSGDVPRLQQVY